MCACVRRTVRVRRSKRECGEVGRYIRYRYDSKVSRVRCLGGVSDWITLAFFCARVAQWIRRCPPKAEIAGSSPAVSRDTAQRSRRSRASLCTVRHLPPYEKTCHTPLSSTDATPLHRLSSPMLLPAAGATTHQVSRSRISPDLSTTRDHPARFAKGDGL